MVNSGSQIEAIGYSWHNFSFWTVIACLIALLTLTSGQFVRGEETGADATKYFHIDSEGQWVEIPDQDLSVYSEQIHRQTDQTIQYLAGYAGTSGKNWFDLPFILVTSDEKGKFPQKKLDELVSKFSKRMHETFGELDVVDVLPPIQVGDMSYEKGRRIIWVEMVSDVPQLGKVHAITAMMLTEIGTLNFILYVASSDREARLREFSKFLNRVKIDPAFVYRSGTERPQRKSLTGALGRGLSRGLVYGAILLFIVLITSAYRLMFKKISKMKKTPKK